MLNYSDLQWVAIYYLIHRLAGVKHCLSASKHAAFVCTVVQLAIGCVCTLDIATETLTQLGKMDHLSAVDTNQNVALQFYCCKSAIDAEKN